MSHFHDREKKKYRKKKASVFVHTFNACMKLSRHLTHYSEKRIKAVVSYFRELNSLERNALEILLEVKRQLYQYFDSNIVVINEG